MRKRGLKILIVDDSAFFRHRIEKLIDSESDLQVVGTANNGDEAIRKTNQLRPDLITMDVQMPGVDGISAVRRIMAECPTRILMLSALTSDGAHETLEALEAGAVDFMPKAYALGHELTDGFSQTLLEKMRTVGWSRTPHKRVEHTRVFPVSTLRTSRSSPVKATETPRLVVIGASTGGPVALQVLLGGLPRNFPLPILVAVHMPGSFTLAYAERLNTICAVQVSQAVDLSPLHAGQVLVAPGGTQMTVDQGASGPHVRVREPRPGDLYHPSVDQLFHSAARTFGKQALGIVLTGMGSDGLNGGRQVKRAGGQLWSQDEKSCVVYGMPHAVEKAGLSDRVLALSDIGQQLVKLS